MPGIQFQGQPIVFNIGTYQRVFYAAWNPTAFNSIAWEMNGLAAIADSTTPVCVSGITGTASDVTMNTATLHGDVDIAGEGTTYHFEYGNGNGNGHQHAYRDSPARPAGSGLGTDHRPCVR